MPQTALLMTLVLLATNALANSISKLMPAVQRGEVAVVAKIINQIPIDSRDPQANTAVHQAVISNQADVLAFLITNGADPNLMNADGNTAYDLYSQYLHDSSTQQSYDETGEIGLILRNAAALTADEVAEALDQQEASSPAGRVRAKRYTEMLFVAAKAGDRETIEMLLQSGANPKAKNAAGEFPFHIAEQNRHFACCAILLRAIGGVNRGDNRSWKPMHWAILAKDWDMVRELIHANASFRYRGNSDDDEWSNQDEYDIAELTHQEDRLVAMAIAEQGHNPKTMHGLIEKATRQGRLDIYRRLVAHGLDLQDQEVAQVALSMLFSRSHNYTELVINFLLDNDVNKFALAEKMTGHGVLTAHESVVRKILEYGINPNEPDTYGSLPLVSAVKRSGVMPSSFQLLLQHGADPNKTQKNGETALIAIAQKITSNYYNYSKLNRDLYLELIRILLAHGANPNAVLQNETALDILQSGLQRMLDYPMPTAHTDNNIDTLRSIIELLVANGAKSGQRATTEE